MMDKKLQQLAGYTVDVHRDGATATTDYGRRTQNLDDWLAVGNAKRVGPQLLEDQHARERINRFDHERIPERVVHARGVGAFGTFRLLESAEDVTCAKILTDTTRETPMFARISTVLGSRGSADTVRDVRGFALKIYTDEGNWDIVGNNIPVFFIQDAMKFPDIIHAGKPEPDVEVPQAQTAHNSFWDFQYLHSEATHMFMWAVSDRAIPRSLRMMQGFGVNTYKLINAEGAVHFVKFHWTPVLGVHSCIWDEFLKIGGQDPDFHRKDLYEAIEKGVFPKWKFGIQTLKESQQDDFDFDILDATKIWPEELCGPVRYIAEFELNRNVDEYFSQTEQIAFCTSHIVPGIDFSDDPLLQGRNFSYLDTQISRLGVNFQDLPINRPVCPVMNFHRDGQGSHKINKGKANYWPNRFDAIPPAELAKPGCALTTSPQQVQGAKARLKSVKFSEHFEHARIFYHSLTPYEQAHVKSALCFELDHCDDPVVYKRLCERLRDIDHSVAHDVAMMVGGDSPSDHPPKPYTGLKSSGLSQTHYQPVVPTIASRRIAILVGDGFNGSQVRALLSAMKVTQAFPYIIGVRRSTIKAQEGTHFDVTADHHLEGFRSTMVDALFIPSGEHVETLMKSGRARHWIAEAFGHCKAIGAVGNAVELVDGTLATAGLSLRLSKDEAISNTYGVTCGRTLSESSQNDIRMSSDSRDFIARFFYDVSQHRNYQRELDGLTSKIMF